MTATAGAPDDAADFERAVLPEARRLFGLAHTILCIHRRRSMLRRLVWPAERFAAEAPAPPPATDDRLLGFDAVFRRLSPSQRAAFVLHVQHGYTVDECAQLLGCRPGTARSHLGRAVATLKKELSDG